MSGLRRTRRSVVVVGAVGLLLGSVVPLAAQQGHMAPPPARGYLAAHASVDQPLGLLGGAITVDINQANGGVFVALPDARALDANVFGTPDHPRATGGTPGINGLPLMARDASNGHFTTMKGMSPFGDKHMVMGNGHLRLHMVDATATDAATSDDRVRMEASWQDGDGNTYTVRCCRMLATHGLEFPTFGGVVTNHLLHGFTRLGTALMPTEFTYAGFWGMGAVLKNGEVLDQPRLIHGMLTEYVRGEGYTLDSDDQVTPTRQQFHLMVAPFAPNMQAGHFDRRPVHTGLTLPNGMELPFWHVMFENLDISSARN